MSIQGWQSALGDLLDAVTREEDAFALNLRTATDPHGGLFKDRLPQDVLRTDGDDLDGWWTDTDAALRAVWMRHGWGVLRANPATLTGAFARLSGEQQGHPR